MNTDRTMTAKALELTQEQLQTIAGIYEATPGEALRLSWALVLSLAVALKGAIKLTIQWTAQDMLRGPRGSR
jgi:hypothetical protein